MIIVTGGAGFIGSNIVAELEARGFHDITICDTLGMEDKWRNIAKREIRDIVRPEDLFDYMKKRADEIDVIIHMGAISATTEKNADAIVENNYKLSRMLWKFCANYDVRLIYASSAATYGDGECGFNDDEHIRALAQLQPLNAYGWSKHAFDRRVARLTQDSSMQNVDRRPRQWVGLKFFNVYGPNEYHKGDMQSVISKLYKTIQNNEPAKLFMSHKPEYNNGGQLRDFIYVKDCVDVVMHFLEKPEYSGIYNCGTGKARSFKDLALATYTACGIDPDIEYIPMPDHLRGKYQYFTQANMEKLRATGYSKTFTSLEDGALDYVRNYLAKDDSYR